MVTGIVLVNVERPYSKKVIERIMDFDGVAKIYTVAGEYDLVVMVKVDNNKELLDIITHKILHEVEGITHTKTLVASEIDAKVS